MPGDSNDSDMIEVPVDSPFDIESGMRLRLKDGSIVEVVDNPRDGVWVFCAAQSSGGPASEPVYLDDVTTMLRRAGGDRAAGPGTTGDEGRMAQDD